MRRRTGFTLIELIVVLTAGSVVLAACAAAITLLLRSEAASVQSLASDATLARLARQFREDVHATLDATMPAADAPSAASLQLTLPEGAEITFRSDERGVIRTLRHGDTTTSTERFVISNATARFEISEAKDFVTLAISRQDPNAGTKGKPEASPSLRIEAALARNHPFVPRLN